MDALFRADAYAKSCSATVISVDETGIRLDRTIFYPNGGGQPGDTGTLRAGDVVVTIVDTIKGEGGSDDVIHVPAPGSPTIAAGASVEAEIDWERRHRHMRMHTALHLLSAWAPGEITGAQITAEKSRIDFNAPTSALDKATITEAINAMIARDIPVSTQLITDAELDARPELIKTMSIRPPRGAGTVRLVGIDDTDLQPCGGTHVARTGEIGRVEVVKIENKGKQNRRVVIQLVD